jgi:hypothetical protein
MDEHLPAGFVDPGAVAAEDHRQPFGGQSDTSKRPEVVVVEGGRLDRTVRPAGTEGRFGALADLEAGQRVVGGLAGGIGSETASMNRAYGARHADGLERRTRCGGGLRERAARQCQVVRNPGTRPTARGRGRSMPGARRAAGHRGKLGAE